MSEPEVRIASVYYGKQQWTKSEGRWYVKMFGTTGPGQNPHWSWGEVSEGRVPVAVREKLRG